MQTIHLCLGSSTIWARDLCDGQEVSVVSRAGPVWSFVIDDKGFAQGERCEHDWIGCRDQNGRYIEMHIDGEGRIERIAVFNRLHENAPENRIDAFGQIRFAFCA